MAQSGSDTTPCTVGAVSLSDLNAMGGTLKDFATCVGNGVATTACDYTVTDLCASYPGLKDSIFCACVNSGVANPACILAGCADCDQSYKTTGMVNMVESGCPKTIYCDQVTELGGIGNVASGLTQEQNCGGGGEHA